MSEQPKGNIRVKEKVIRDDRAPLPDEQAAGVVYKAGELPLPELVNRQIEDPELRSRIPSNNGNVCITIQPGATLGQLAVNVQFEGRRGDYDFCLEQHNDLLLHISAILQEFLGEFAADFEVSIDSKPCPKTERRVSLDLAAQVLEQRTTAQEVLQKQASEVQIRHGERHQQERRHEI